MTKNIALYSSYLLFLSILLTACSNPTETQTLGTYSVVSPTPVNNTYLSVYRAQKLYSVNQSNAVGLVVDAYWTQNNKYIVSGGADNSIRIFDLGGEQKAILHHNVASTLVSVAVSTDSKLIASASIDGTIILWDADKNSEIVRLVNSDYQLRKIEFTPDNKNLVVLTSGARPRALLLNLTSGQPQRLYTDEVGVVAVTANPNLGKYLFGLANGRILIWDYFTRSSVELASPQGKDKLGLITSLALTKNGSHLISVYRPSPESNDIIMRWDLQSHKSEVVPISSVRETYNIAVMQQPITNIVILAISNQQGEITLFDLEKGSQISKLQGHSSFISSLRFDEANNHLLTASVDKSIKVWDISQAKSVLTIASNDYAPVTSQAIDASNKLFAGGFSNGEIKVWNVKGGKQTLTIKAHTLPVTKIAISPNGELLATTAKDPSSATKFDNEVKIWSSSTGQLVASHKYHKKFLLALTFSADSQNVFSSSFDNQLVAYNITKAVANNIGSNSDHVYSFDVSPNGKFMAVTTGTDFVKVYNLESQQKISEWAIDRRHAGVVKFNWNSTSLFLGGETLTEWDISTGVKRQEFANTSSAGATLGISNDDKLLFSIGLPQNTIDIWEVASGKKIAAIPLGSFAAHITTLSKDAKFLLTSSQYSSEITIFSVTS
jgi:WD40 repeat protein